MTPEAAQWAYAQAVGMDAMALGMATSSTPEPEFAGPPPLSALRQMGLKCARRKK